MAAFHHLASAAQAADRAVNQPPAPLPGEFADWLSFITTSAGVGHWRYNPTTGASEFSPLCASLLGLDTPPDYPRLLAALHPDDAGRLERTLRHGTSAADGASSLFDLELRLNSPLTAPRDDGESPESSADADQPRWIHLKGRRVISPDGATIAEGVLLDITARKHAEAARERAEKRLAQAADASRVVFWEMDLSTGYTRCSPNADALWGFSEGPGDAFFQRIHPDDRQPTLPHKDELSGQRAYAREYRITTVGGDLRWIHARGDIIPDDHGRPARMAGVSVDITERKLVEDDLRTNQRWLEMVLQGASVGAWENDLETGANTWGQGMAELLGLTPEQAALEGARWLDHMHPDDVANAREQYERVRRDLDAIWAPEVRMRHADGTWRWLRCNGRRVTGPDGRAKLAGIAQDVTERHRARDALKETNERLRLAQSYAQIGVWSWDPSTGIVAHNPELEQLYGVPPGGLATYDAWARLLGPEVHTRAAAERDRALAERRQFTIEFPVVTPSGEHRWFLARGRGEYDERGALVRVTGVDIDITARRAAELALAETNDRFARAEHAAHLGSWDWDLRTQRVLWSDGMYDLLGVPRRSFDPSFERWSTFLIPECRDAILAQARQAIDSGGDFSIELRIRRADGAVRWLASIGRVEKDVGGAPARMLGINIDITDRKLGEQSLLEAQARERAYLEHLPVGVWFIDSSGTIIYGNPAGRQIWAGARYVGTDEFHEYKAWWHGTDRRVAAHEWGAARAIQKGETRLDELLDIECFDGTRKTILNSAVPMRDAQDRIIGAVVINQDVTKLKEAEHRLRESESTLRSFYESSPLMMGVVEVPPDDSDIIRVYDNPSMERFFGMAPGSTAGLASKSFAPPAEKLDEWIVRYRESERLGQPLSFEYTHPVGDRTVWFSCAVACLGPGKRGTRFSYVAEDISERKTTELALVEAQSRLREHAAQLERTVAERTAELREINEQLETFVYSVAHDLRAPLRSLSGFSQLLVEDHARHLDGDGKDMLRRIQRSAEFMDKLVLDLLAFGRAARAEIELSPVPVAEAWMAACFQCADEIKRTAARIEIDEPLPRVLAHEATLSQMLANLLGNALKFVAPGVTPQIRFRCEPRGEFIRLCVDDNGTGISADQHERVFRVFERLHGSTYPGTGVGLAIVRKGAERLGGRAGVESTLGQGSRFWIDLKRA